MSDKCVNPSCKHPDSAKAAKGLCWPCYQAQRRAGIPKRKVAPCVEGRRYHSYDELDRCRFCGVIRIFNF